MNALPLPPPQQKRCVSGFSLVEVLIALLIGLIAMLVMTQVFSWTEGQRRTTTSGGDAQTNGAIALYGLQREIGLAGHGINSTSVLGCNLTIRAGVTVNGVGPVVVNHASVPAGDANTDTLLVMYTNSSGSPEGDGITAQPGTTSFTVQTPSSFAIGNVVLATPQVRATPCNLSLDTVAAVAAPNVITSAGAAGMTNGTLFNMGTAFVAQAFAVRNANLTVCDLMVSDCFAAGNVGNSAIWVPIANNVVSMRVQYGRDTDATMDGSVDVFDQSISGVIPAQCAWSRVSAVRLVLVSRSTQFEKGEVTGVSPSWSGTADTPIDISKNPDGSASTNWKRYRYKAFETVVPMRNVAWMGVPSGC